MLLVLITDLEKQSELSQHVNVYVIADLLQIEALQSLASHGIRMNLSLDRQGIDGLVSIYQKIKRARVTDPILQKFLAYRASEITAKETVPGTFLDRVSEMGPFFTVLLRDYQEGEKREAHERFLEGLRCGRCCSNWVPLICANKACKAHAAIYTSR